MPRKMKGCDVRIMNPLILIGILLVLFCGMIGYACIIVGSDAERESEAYIERKRIREEQQREPTGD